MSKALRLTLLSLAVIVMARLAYVVVEASYNAALLDLASTPLVTSAHASMVESLGHKLAALGLALLVTPAVTAFAMKKSEFSTLVARLASKGAVFTVVFLATFTSGYHLQAFLMDEAVESASTERRFQAYYLALFRQLYIDGSVHDPALNDTDSHLGPAMLAMPFAWSEEKDISGGLLERGRDIVLARAQRQAVAERFEDDYKAYLALQNRVSGFLDAYQAVSAHSAKVSDTRTRDPVYWYGKSVSTLYDYYPAYSGVTARWREHVQTLNARSDILSTVREIFSGSENQRQWRHSVLVKKLGLSEGALELSDWCGSGCPGSAAHIRRTVQEAVAREYQTAGLGVPPGLTLKGFLTSHHAFNAAVGKLGLTDKGDLFSHSPVTLERFIDKSGAMAMGTDISPELSKNFPFVAGMTLPAGMADADILANPQFKRWAAERYGSRIASFPLDLTREDFFYQWLEESKSIVEESMNLILPTSAASMEEGRVASMGLSAVKLLYIPPVAAFLSAAMVLLSLCAILYQVTEAFLGRRAGTVATGLFGGGAALVAFALGADPMPTPLMQAEWASFAEANPLLAVLWQVFFGIEQIVLAFTGGGAAVVPPGWIDEALKVTLGWAL